MLLFFLNKAKVTQSFRVAMLFVLTIGTIETRIKPSLYGEIKNLKVMPTILNTMPLEQYTQI